jgi:hypothetical protein
VNPDQLPPDERTVWLAAFAASFVAAINSDDHYRRQRAATGAAEDAEMATDAYRKGWK